MDAREPAADLAIATALAASALDAPACRDAIAIGEVGLGGELRSVPRAGARLAEAAKLGFKRAIVPASQELPPRLKLNGMRVVKCKTLAEALPLLVDVGAFKSRRRGKKAQEESDDFDVSDGEGGGGNEERRYV